MTPTLAPRRPATTPNLPWTAGIDRLIRLALDEDIGRGDLTTAVTVAPETTVHAVIRQKQPGVVCGLPVVAGVFAAIDPSRTGPSATGSSVTVSVLADEGSWGADRLVAEIAGPAHTVLAGERTALNFLQRLSGIATASQRAAELVAGTGVTVLDTRKTAPGHRVLEKYAVRVGGCHNHRGGLDDGILIKDNHIRAAGGITAAVAAALRRVAPMQTVEVEVTTLDELDEAIAAGAAVALLDNMDLARLRAAVARARGRVRLEASGGITLENLRAVAETGVDFISLGALTYAAGALDFSLDVI